MIMSDFKETKNVPNFDRKTSAARLSNEPELGIQ